MTFTDNDLELFKKDLRIHGADIFQPEEFWQALVARLEVEKNCADLLQLHYESGVFDDLDEGDVALIVQALEAKRKAAGK